MAISAKHKEITFNVGDTVKVFYRIIEREKKAGKTKRSVKIETKERIQPFDGMVIGIKGREENKSFTVRKIASAGVGVERVFPLASPWIEKIEIKQRGRVRRSKLYYLRDKPQLDVKKRTTPRAKRRKRSSKIS